MSDSSKAEGEQFPDLRRNLRRKHHKQLGRPVSDVRKIRQASHQMPFMTIPKKIIEGWGLLKFWLNGELYTYPLEINYLKREIRVRFPSPEELVKRNSKSNSKDKVS